MKTDYYASAEWIERIDSALADMVASFDAHGRKRAKWRITWQPVNAEAVARIWLVYGKRGTVFDSEGLARITEQVLNLIARLHVSTAISGHATFDMRPEAEEYRGRAFTNKQWARFVDGMEDREGRWFLSDYGMRPLEALFVRLFRAATDEERLMTLDRVFNVVHQRGDLAAMFIQGGTATLNRIAAQGGYVTPFENFEDQCRQQRQYANT